MKKENKKNTNNNKRNKRLLIIGVIVLIAAILCFILYFLALKYNIPEKKLKKIITDDAKDAIYKKTKETQIKENIDFDEFKKEGNNYKVTFFYAGTQFEYVIDEKTGKIISNTLDNYEGNLELVQSEYISEEDAKKLVLEDLNASDEASVNFTNIKTEKELEKLIYIINCTYDNYDYEYTVDGISKKVLTYFTKKTKHKNN